MIVPAYGVATSLFCAWLYRRALGDRVVRLEQLLFDVNVAMARLYALGLDINDREFLDAVVEVMAAHSLVITTVVVEIMTQARIKTID